MNNTSFVALKLKGAAGWVQKNPNLSISLFVFLLLLPFINKPFNIDDPVYVWMAEQILSHPFDPFGFSLNWERAEEPVWLFNKNPPLVSYFIASIALFRGFAESALHTGFILPAIAVVTGTYQLARRLTSRPFLAALLTACSPAFLVSATTVMSDIPMLAFYIWALVCWDRGLEKNSRILMVTAALLASAAMLTKYFGVSVVALMAVHALANRYPLRRWTLWLVVPLAVLLAYQYWSQETYGLNFFLDAGNKSLGFRKMTNSSLPVTTMVALSFMGASLAWAGFAIPLLSANRRWWFAAMLVIVASLLMQPLLAEHYANTPPAATSYAVLAQMAFWTIGSVVIFVLACQNLRDDAHRSGWLLFCWVGGTFVFSAYVNWTVNARTLLPLIPAAAILLSRRLDDFSGTLKMSTDKLVLLVLPAAVVALMAATSDYRQAIAVRSTVETIVNHHKGELDRLRFTGHWGFQYYMNQYGIGIVEVSRSEFVPGDLLAVPDINSLQIQPPVDIAPAVFEVNRPKLKWLATMSDEAGAGFYSSIYGPLPYVFCSVSPERAVVHRFDYHVSPQSAARP